LTVRLPDGSTELDNIESAARQGDRSAQQRLDGLAVCPEVVVYLWDYFLQIHQVRRNYGWGATPLTYTEIYHWTLLRGIKLDAWELDTLLLLDDCFLVIWHKHNSKKEAGNGGS
jgi:hypothetical protein